MSLKKNQHGIIFVVGVILIDAITFGIVLPIMPHLISVVSDTSLSDAARLGGYLTLGYASLMFFSAPILGNLSDKYGRRPILLFTFMALCLTNILMAMASSIFFLFFARLVAGIASSTMVAATAYVTDVTSIEMRAKRFGMIGAAYGLGVIIGPSIGGMLGGFGLRVPFITVATLGLMIFIYGYFFLDESLKQEYRRAFDIRRSNPISAILLLKTNPMVAGFAASNFLFMIGQFAIFSFYAYFLIEKFNWSIGHIGLAIALAGISGFIVQGIVLGKVTNIFGSRKITIFGLVLSVLCYVAFAFAESDWQIYLLIIISGFSGLVAPSLLAMMSGKMQANIQGELQGALSCLNSLALILGPISMLHIFASFTDGNKYWYFPGAPFIATAVVTGMSLLVLLLVLRRN